MRVPMDEPKERTKIRFGCKESFWKEDEDMLSEFDEDGMCDGDGEDGLCQKCKKKLEEYDALHAKSEGDKK